MLHRLSPKEKRSRDLADIFAQHRPEGMTREDLAEAFGVRPIFIRKIEDGKAHKISGNILLKVFDNLPIESLEAREEVRKLIIGFTGPVFT